MRILINRTIFRSRLSLRYLHTMNHTVHPLPPPRSLYPIPSPFKVALIQLNCNEDISDNFNRSSKLIRTAVNDGAQLIFTPECTQRLVGLNMQVDESLNNGFYEEDHPVIAAYRRLAAELKVWMNIGSIPVRAENDTSKMMNRSYLISPAMDQHIPPPPKPINSPIPNTSFNPSDYTSTSPLGSIVARYDKIHLFDVPSLNTSANESYLESARVAPGNIATLVNTPFGRIGLTICYDLRFPLLYHTLSHAGADMISVPAAFTYTTGTVHWHTLLKARAIESGCFILAAAQVGHHPGPRRTYGHSLVITPWGDIIGERKEESEGIVICEIDLNLVSETRKKLPGLWNEREFSLNCIDTINNRSKKQDEEKV